MEELLELYRARAENAIEKTAESYGTYLYRIAYAVLGSVEDANEVVNDTYWKVWNLIPPENPPDLKVFLARTVKQLAVNRMEYNAAQKRGGGEYRVVLEELGECITDNGKAADPAEQIALRDAMERFLRTLSPNARDVFLRRYWYFQSVRSIADDLSVGENAVKSLLMRTRKKLKKYLRKEGFDL